MEEEEYICTLTEASMKVAKEELMEDPLQRASQVQTFREWIQQQPHMRAPTDTAFLLKFLRPAKYSQLVARNLLEGYLKVKVKFPEWVNDIDTADPKLHVFLRTGGGFASPHKDSKGRTILIMKEGSFNPDKKTISINTIIKAYVTIACYCNLDENNVVNGYVFLRDMTLFTMKHLTFMGMDTFRKYPKLFEGNIPGRFKEFHFFNPGPVFEAVMTAIKPLFSKKLQERFHVHGKSLEDIYKVIPEEVLPEEYLPDDYKGKHPGKSKDIIEDMITKLKSPEVRERILYETSSQWTFDQGEKPMEQSASFRKLVS